MKPRCQSCNSCGMPLEKKEDFALGDTSASYCQYCTDKKGQLLPYEEILKNNSDYLNESQGLTSAAALKMAKDLLKEQPAWKHVGA
ncbi:MAG: zinc ribbon domain-containing protein [Bdellovibrionota bacterium]